MIEAAFVLLVAMLAAFSFLDGLRGKRGGEADAKRRGRIILWAGVGLLALAVLVLMGSD